MTKKWDMVLEIYNDYLELFDFSDFEEKYGHRLDDLGIEANAGNVVDWYLGQFREICKDEEKANQYMERALSVDRETNTFFFATEEFLGQDLHYLFVQTDQKKEHQERYFDKKHHVENGWHDSDSFPGHMIFPDFCWGNRTSYLGVKVALLMEPDTPNGLLEEIIGTVTNPYVPIDEDGTVGTIFELELESGERRKYNSNSIVTIKAQEQSEETYHSIKSGLESKGFALYPCTGFIPAGSELAVIEGDPASHSFSVNKYVMTSERNFGAGSLAGFDVSKDDQIIGLNINDLPNRMYVKPPE